MKIKLRISKGMVIWQFIQGERKPLTTMKYYGRNFNIPKQKEVKK